LIGRPGEGRAALDAALDEARIALSAEMLGAADTLFHRTLDYLRVRKQFGRAIGSFQALQHRAVDLHVQLELSRAAVNRAANMMSGFFSIMRSCDPPCSAMRRRTGAASGS
jgi:alkylation response protein AidB-like acyl-CoA dehydrogenase